MADTPRKNLFVDANIFLGFYHFSSDDLDELQKLVELIKKDEIALYVTEQVMDEVKRNRDTKIQDGYKRFKEIEFKPSFPHMCKAYPEYEEIRRSLSIAERQRAELERKLLADIESRSLKADEVINELLKLAKIVDTEDVKGEAHLRYLAGNPPGKNDSYGDAITWEGLLASVPDGEPLFFVSADKDYRSSLGEDKFDSFLSEEWESEKKSKVHYYPRLGAFFAEHHRDIALRLEEEKKSLTEELTNSGSFAETHSIVRKLSRIGEFSDDEILHLVDAALSNGQVYSIMSDADLKRFFGKILAEKREILSLQNSLALESTLETGRKPIEVDDSDF